MGEGLKRAIAAAKATRPLTPTERLAKIAEILEGHDHYLLAADGPVSQESPYLREIYLLAKGRA